MKDLTLRAFLLAILSSENPVDLDSKLRFKTESLKASDDVAPVDETEDEDNTGAVVLPDSDITITSVEISADGEIELSV